MRASMVKRIALSLLALGLLAVLAGWAFVHLQGRDMAEVVHPALPAGAEVRWDAYGVPTMTAKSWPELIELEGSVVASERLFQMDLMRRSASGRLSEWFGKATLPVDRRRRMEDWEGIADREFAHLPPEEKLLLERYAAGVNRFIEEHPWRWGLEYLLLRVRPEPWQGRDSLLLLLAMCEQLASSASIDATETRLKKDLSPAWGDFLFPEDHPWNQPLFDHKAQAGPTLPLGEPLPKKAIDAAELAALSRPEARVSDDDDDADADAFAGSNNWAWCGKTGCFIANDPHLGSSVPQLWFAVRLRISDLEWAVGVSIPGIPGLVLGMNPSLAWAFTNTGEDVDDYLLETLNPDRTQYLSTSVDGREVWVPVIEKRSVIHVKDAPDETVDARFTHRGPLSERKELAGAWASRQWLPLKEGVLRVPSGMLRARSIEEMNQALDGMRVPGQNVVFGDRHGNLAYRASGTGIDRKVSGRVVQPGAEGEWAGLLPAASRRRMTIPTSTAPRFIATANERIWIDPYGHPWGPDARKDRIRTRLSSGDAFSRQDMEALQRDTYSRYAVLLLGWIAARAKPTDEAHKAIVARWTRWDGLAEHDAETFTEALAAHELLERILIGRVREHLPKADADVPYNHPLRQASLLAVLGAEHGMALFGLDEVELAGRLLERAAAVEKSGPRYTVKQRWQAQHPFAGRIPFGIGEWFKVDEREQIGHGWLVRVESPNFGASTRMVWDLFHPENSTWSFPVGQSGHPGSPHFSDQRADWFDGRPHPVLDPHFTWSVPK
jgi:penicillin amidase